MDKAKIKHLCEQIILAANGVEVKGEANMAQLMGICRAARYIAAEANKAEEGKADGSGT